MEKTSRWWLFDSHNSYKRSQWLDSTLAELDAKTKAMLKLIEEDADSFAQRAEMYYKKRPELISMVEDFYRTHRSLAERYDLVMRSADRGSRLVNALGSPFSSLNIHVPKKSTLSPCQKRSESCSMTCEIEEYAELEVNDSEEEHVTRDSERDDRSTIDEEKDNVEVDNPEVEIENRDSEGDDRSTIDEERDNVEVDNPERENEGRDFEGDERSTIDEERDNTEMDNPEEEDENRDSVGDDRSTIDEEGDNVEILRFNGIQRMDEEEVVAVMKMTEELERLREENRVINEQLRLKDNEKREVIRHLSLAVELLKEENLKLKKYVVGAKKEESPKKPWSPFEFKKLKEGFLGKLVTGSPPRSSRVLTF